MKLKLKIKKKMWVGAVGAPSWLVPDAAASSASLLIWAWSFQCIFSGFQRCSKHSYEEQNANVSLLAAL